MPIQKLFSSFDHPGVYFDGGESGSGGSTDDGSGTKDGKKADEGHNAGKSASNNNGNQLVISFSPEQQDHIENVIIPARLKRAKFDADQVAETARKKAEEESLTKNKEFEALAATRQQEIEAKTKEIAELKKYQEQSEKYAEAIGKIVKTQTEKFPKPVQVLLAKMDPLEQMEYIAQFAKELNLDLKDVPETDLTDPSKKQAREVLEKGKNEFGRTVKSFLR